MNNKICVWGKSVMILFASLMPILASGDNADNQQIYGTNEYGIWLGALSWPDLSDAETANGESFDDLGFVLGLSWQHDWRRWHNADVVSGVSTALFSTSSDVRGNSDDLIQRGIFVTPTLGLRYGERSKTYAQIQIGAGWYNMDIAELDCDSDEFLCQEVEEQFSSNQFGGFIGLRAGHGKGWFIELQTHFADFGELTGVQLENADIGGPFYMLNIGYSWRN